MLPMVAWDSEDFALRRAITRLAIGTDALARRFLVPQLDEREVCALVLPSDAGSLDPEDLARVRAELKDLGYRRAPRSTRWLLCAAETATDQPDDEHPPTA